MVLHKCNLFAPYHNDNPLGPFYKHVYSVPFSLETSRYTLVAKALRYKMTFSKSSKTDIFCDVENQRKINTEKLIHLPSPNKSA
ncbi:MAG: hypothetical protein HDR34_06985 [Treponema sp.]|nr:hypothetical protein [Treponema sp.]